MEPVAQLAGRLLVIRWNWSRVGSFSTSLVVCTYSVIPSRWLKRLGACLAP